MAERRKVDAHGVDRAPALRRNRNADQRSAGHRSRAGSNYGDYVPSRSKSGVQQGGEDRADASTNEAQRAEVADNDRSTASNGIPWRGDADGK